MRPLYITGLGLVSPLGAGVDEFWSRLGYGSELPIDLGMPNEQVPNSRFYLSEQSLDESHSQSESRAFALAMRAVRDALEDAKLDLSKQRVALVLGTGAGDIELFERHNFSVGTMDIENAYSLAARIGRHLGFNGPVVTVSTACSASAAAFSIASELLEDGNVEAAVVCGVESVSRTTLATFNRLQALDPSHCRPFEESRAGTVLGDGAAALVLRMSAPEGAERTYARLSGIGLACDAHHPTAPRPDGTKIAAAARDALAQAGIDPDAISLIVPHGTGTRANDEAEYAMLRKLFGDRLPTIPMFPLKSKIGHTSGGAGAFSALTLALMLYHQQVPCGMGGALDSNFDLHIPDMNLPVKAGHGLVNAYSFGGNHVSLVLEVGA